MTDDAQPLRDEMARRLRRAADVVESGALDDCLGFSVDRQNHLEYIPGDPEPGATAISAVEYRTEFKFQPESWRVVASIIDYDPEVER